MLYTKDKGCGVEYCENASLMAILIQFAYCYMYQFVGNEKCFGSEVFC